jgi:hypothetical protein
MYADRKVDWRFTDAGLAKKIHAGRSQLANTDFLPGRGSMELAQIASMDARVVSLSFLLPSFDIWRKASTPYPSKLCISREPAQYSGSRVSIHVAFKEYGLTRV